MRAQVTYGQFLPKETLDAFTVLAQCAEDRTVQRGKGAFDLSPKGQLATNPHKWRPSTTQFER